MLTAAIVDTAFIYVSTVGQSIHGVAFVAQTLKTTRGVHTRVITCPLKKALIYILTRTFICEKFEPFLTIAFEAADGVPAEVIAAAVVQLALVNIFTCFSVRL